MVRGGCQSQAVDPATQAQKGTRTEGGSRAVRGAVPPALPRVLTPGGPGGQSRGHTERPGVWERLLRDEAGI